MSKKYKKSIKSPTKEKSQLNEEISAIIIALFALFYHYYQFIPKINRNYRRYSHQYLLKNINRRYCKNTALLFISPNSNHHLFGSKKTSNIGININIFYRIYQLN